MFPILIIEDDPAVRLLLREEVARLGLDPLTCPTPPDLESLLREVRNALDVAEPVAALVDLGLPNPEEGEQVLRLLKEARPQLPVVAVSGSRRHQPPPGIPLLKKDRSLGRALEGALSALPMKPAHLARRVELYLGSVRQAVALWHRSRGPEKEQLLLEARDESGQLSHDHQKFLKGLLDALQAPDGWPPPLPALHEMREKITRLVGLLGPSEIRRAHYLSHRLVGNVLLGLEYIQGVLHDARPARRLLEASLVEGSGVRPERARLLRDIAEVLERPQSDRERVGNLADCLAEELLSPENERLTPWFLPGWGRIARAVVVENDEVLHQFLRSSLGVFYPGLPIEGFSSAREARDRLAKVPAPEQTVLLLDLSIPRVPGSAEEHPDFGREVLQDARGRGFPVVVMTAVTELPECLRSTTDLHPVGFIPKSTAHEIRERLRILLRPELQETPDSRSPVLVLRNRGRQVLVDQGLVDLGPACLKLLKVMARKGGAATLDQVCEDEDFLAELRGHEDGEPLSALRGRVDDRVRAVNRAWRAAMADRGRPGEDLLVLEGRGEDTRIAASRRLVMVPPEDLDVLATETGEDTPPTLEPQRSSNRPLRILHVDPDRLYSQAVQGWLEETFPDRLRFMAHASTLYEARQAMAEPFDLVLLEPYLPTGPGERALREVDAALEWLRSMALGANVPDVVVLTASEEPIHEARATSGGHGVCAYIRKAPLEIETRGWLSLAVSEAWRRRFGYPRVDAPPDARPLQVRLTARGVELDGIPIQIHRDVPEKPVQWAAGLVLEVLAANPLIPIDHQVLWELVLDGADRLGEDQGDKLPKGFLGDAVAEARRSIVDSFARHGRQIGVTEAIASVGKKAYRLNAIEADGRI